MSNDFKLLYLIICSRGPGSETICVEDVSRDCNVNDWDWCSESIQDALKKRSVVEITPWHDEGPIIAMTSETKLKDIYKWLQQWMTVDEEEISEDLLESKIMQQIKADQDKNQQAYFSACLRAFVVYFEPDGVHNGPGDSNWTSCNSWRDGDGQLSEALTEKQFELILSCGLTIEELEKWDCSVMRHACTSYSVEGKLVRKGW